MSRVKKYALIAGISLVVFIALIVMFAAWIKKVLFALAVMLIVIVAIRYLAKKVRLLPRKDA